MTQETDKDKLKPVSRNHVECVEGQAAFQEGLPDFDNPYPRGDHRRMFWFAGWLDARTNHSLGHIFKKYGLTHP